MHALSSNTYADAYVQGRMAGEKFFRDERCDPKAARPNNGFASMPLAAGEWERGFAEGYRNAQALSARPAKATAQPVRRAKTPRRKSGWSLGRLLMLGLGRKSHSGTTHRSSRAR